MGDDNELLLVVPLNSEYGNRGFKVVRPLSASSPSYTVGEIEELSRQFIAEQEGDTDMLRWTFSIWLQWLAKREREVGDGRS